MYTNPLVAFDGSPLSRKALIAAVELSKSLGTTLRAVIVDEGVRGTIAAGAVAVADTAVMQDALFQEESWAKGLSAEAVAVAMAAGVTLSLEVIEGDAVEAISRAVSRHRCDLLIVGLRHHPGLLERLTSHTASDISERVECSVLGVR